MTIAMLLDGLLFIGQSAMTADVVNLPGAGNHASVLRLADHHTEHLLTFFLALGNDDRKSLIRALAAYENTVGGLGSVTTLRRLLPLVEDPDRELLEWILSNTRSYWYYSHGATSVSELDAIRRALSDRTDANLKRERAREQEAKQRKAARGTGRLFNAVRRGDIGAVRALLSIGADPRVRAPDGSSLHEHATAMGRNDIAAEIAQATATTSSPDTEV